MRPSRNTAQWEMDQQREEKDRGRRLRDAYIPERYRRLSWSDYEPTARTSEGERLYDILVDYGDHWTPEQRDGLVLLGPPGWGKTMGFALLAMQLIDKGGWVKFLTYAELVERRQRLIQLEQQAQRTEDWGEANAAQWRLAFIEAECDALFLDDVGKEYRSASGWSDDGLDRLLRRRGDLGKTTFISSNLLLQDWVDYNVSMSSFLYEVGEVVQLSQGRDYRKRRTDGQRRRRGEG